MNNLLLINEVNKDTFNPELFGGFIVNATNFVKYFPIQDAAITTIFTEVNDFLISNGYNAFDFTKWSSDDELANELMSVYGDPYCNEENKRLILVIYRLEYTKTLL
jgi:hypothetical protein